MTGAQDIFEQLMAGGAESVKDAIKRNQWEGLYIDFKESKDGGVPSERLTRHGREILGKSISAFANTSGGVLVWGIEAKNNKDVSDSPIPNVARFVQDLNSATASATDPHVEGVVSEPIFLEDQTTGYAVTYIPESKYKPHQCVTSDGVTNYWMRSGESVKPLPHPMVRALFAERESPKLSVMTTRATKVVQASHHPQKAKFSILIKNEGNQLATNVAISLRSRDIYFLQFVSDPPNILPIESHSENGNRSIFVLIPNGVSWAGTSVPIASGELRLDRQPPRCHGIEFSALVMADGFYGEAQELWVDLDGITYNL